MAQCLKNKLINKRETLLGKKMKAHSPHTHTHTILPSKLETSVSIISLTLPRKHIIPVYK